jgi:hypothetical protein
MTTGNRWGRAIGAGVLVELALVIVISLVMVIYSMPGRSTAELMAFGDRAGSWLACIGGPIATFLLARWALRPLSSAHMAHALVVAGVAVAIHMLMVAGMIAGGHPFQWIFALADALKVAGGVAAALLARRNAGGSPQFTSSTN